AGSSAVSVFAMAESRLSQPVFILADENEFSKLTRELVMNRMFTPNCSVWFPLTHVISSTRLWTGIMALCERVNAIGLLRPERPTEGEAEAPDTSPPCLVYPQRRLFTRFGRSSAV